MLPNTPVFEPDFTYSSFTEAIGIVPVGGDGDVGTYQYSANLPRDWCIGFVPHGGFLTSLLLHTAVTHMTTCPTLSQLSQPHPLHTAATFLTRCAPGPAMLTVSLLKTGRQFSFLRVSLRQHAKGVVCLEGTIIFTHFTRLQSGLSLRTAPARPIPPRGDEGWTSANDPLDDFRPATRKLLYWVTPGTHFGSDRSASPSVREQWVKMADGTKFGIAALGYVSDMFLPPPENYDETEGVWWYATLSLSLEIKRAPPEGEGGWDVLFCRIESKVIERGRMDMTVEIFDREERVVGISHHVTVMIDAERNTGKVKQLKL